MDRWEKAKQARQGRDGNINLFKEEKSECYKQP